MSIYTDRARELRAIITPHYNCAQAVLLPFVPLCGITEEEGLRLAANLGGGMRIASACGAFVGAVLALGLCGVDDPAVVQRLALTFRENHEGAIDCGDLLKRNAEKGREKKPFCDAMVLEAVGLVEEILRERGIIGA